MVKFSGPDIVKPTEKYIQDVANGLCECPVRPYVNYFRYLKGLPPITYIEMKRLSPYILSAWFYDQCKKYVNGRGYYDKKD